MRVKQPNSFVGLMVYAAAILLLMFAAAPLQLSYGLWGLILTEFIILACAIIPVLLFQYGLKSIFMIKLPTIHEVYGAILLWLGTLPLIYLVTIVTMYLFPQGMGEVSQSLNDFFTSAPLPVALLAVAVMPAFCEEMLFRGFLQSMFGKIKKQWLIILLTSVLFGIFHVDVYRFLPTTLLGILFCYVMAESGTILLPILLHFINNAWSTSMTFLSQVDSLPVPVQSVTLSLAAIGMVLAVCAMSPWLLMAGQSKLKKSKQVIEAQRNHRGIAIGISAMFLLSGFGVTAASVHDSRQQTTILNMSLTAQPDQESDTDTYPITIEQSGYYNIEYSIGSANDKTGHTTILLRDAKDQIVFEITGGELFGNTPMELSAGAYSLSLVYQYSWQEEQNIAIQFKIIKLSSKTLQSFEKITFAGNRAA